MVNRLSKENSPYLIQHQHNPVDWYAWSREALEIANREDKPIFLSIGYAACHWCHVMAHESFEDAHVAGFMNEHFVNIKVDREERPDLDSIYMNAVVAMTGQGGWPMSVFLTPAGAPFYGGTYFPPSRQYNRPSFMDVLTIVARLWNEDRDRLLKSGAEILQHLGETQQVGQAAKREIKPELLEETSYRLAQNYDWEFGGWGQAPKFPQPMTIDFLLRRAYDGDKLSIEVAAHALDAMAQGGMYDVIGGGFARYSTDNQWLTPHFEKMLYDNALLARAYLHAYLLTRDPNFLKVCRDTLDFIQRELTADQGGFFSSLDADSEGEEGKYYLWSMREIQRILSEAQSQFDPDAHLSWSDFFIAAYGVTPGGNFEGENILRRALSNAELAEKFSITADAAAAYLEKIRPILLNERQKRIRPNTDDKILAAWNGLALLAFAEAARYLNDPGYLVTAQKNAAFLLSALYLDHKLYRSWRDGNAQHTAFLEDHSSLILGLLALYQTDHNSNWFIAARELTEAMLMGFSDPAGGFFDTSVEQDPLIIRPKDLQDNAVPCGNSMAAMALLQMAAYTGNSNYRDRAEQMLAAILGGAQRYPTAFANWLSASHFLLSSVREVAIILPDDLTHPTEFTRVLWSGYQPTTLIAVSPHPPTPGSPELLNDRKIMDGQITAYVCKDFICLRPVHSPLDFLELIRGNS